MKYHSSSARLGILLLSVVILFVSGCGPSLKLVKNNFYAYNGLSSELRKIEESSRENVVHIETIGKTYEERSIFAVRLSGNASTLNNKPALMAIFTEHGNEHDVTNIATGIIHYLSRNYGKDDRVTALLNGVDVWIVPMMNPDGTEHDLSGSVKPFSWRKNRRPTGKDTFGVDLNRNWGHGQNSPIPEDLAKDLSDRNSPVYAGEAPFSEKETQAIRDFLLSHPNIKIFVDYHSGSFGFVQGGAGCFSSRSQQKDIDSKEKILCEEIIESFVKEISNPRDNRPAFVAITNEQDVAKTLRKYAPFYFKPFIPKSIPPAPGVSGEFVYGQLGIMAIGVEIFRDRNFFEELPESKTELVKNQMRGIMFLLGVLSDKSLE